MVIDETVIEWQLDDDVGLTWGTDEYVETRGAYLEDYEGPYEANPTFSEQVFSTTEKVMTDDFTVNGILKLEVDNDAGGLTLTI